MRVIIEPNYDRMSKWAADYVAKRIIEAQPTAEKPFKLGCPTGSSPLGLYKELVRKYEAGELSFENVITFNMGTNGCSIKIGENVLQFRNNLEK